MDGRVAGANPLLCENPFKAGLYDSHVVPEYRIVDLCHRTVEVRRQPVDGGYVETLVLRGDDSIAVEGKTLAVSSILPSISPGTL